jgi:GNAT superfamily N-acetyltransferase
MIQSANQTVSVQIRDASPEDQVAIQELTLAAYQEYAARFPAHWENYRQNILATLALAASAEQIVAEQNGAILGSALLFPAGIIGFDSNGTPVTSQWPEVRLLAVAPSSRGQGIGAALMEECVRRARASGAAVLTLHTTDMMQSALRLYERMGFVRASELDFHPAPDLTVKGYRLTLKGSSQYVAVIDRLL